jgi:hypothetical protein
MEISNVRVHKIISDDFFFIFKFDEITLICTDQWLWNSKTDFVPILSWYMQKIIEKMSTLISTFHFRLHNSTVHLSKLYWSFLEVLKPSETYYVENIKSTNFILVQTQVPRIYESTNL